MGARVNRCMNAWEGKWTRGCMGACMNGMSGWMDGLTLLTRCITFPHAQYDNVWETIANVFKASLGEILEFAKSIIDKLGQFLCDSGDTFTEEAAATNPPADCGIVGQVSPSSSTSNPLWADLVVGSPLL